MSKISDDLSNPKDKKIAEHLEREIARARWCGCDTCCISSDAARYLLAMLVEKEKKKCIRVKKDL